MKLHWSPRSPFVRKVMVFAHETGLVDRLICVRTVVAMKAPNAALLPDNPLSKIPTLVLDDGSPLYDSGVICEYLDTLHDQAKMFPAVGVARWTALRRQALGDGFLDFLLLWRHERERSPSSQMLLDAFASKYLATMKSLETEAIVLDRTPFGIGHIAIGCGLSYLDFRFPGLAWRDGYPQIATWHASFAPKAFGQSNGSCGGLNVRVRFRTFGCSISVGSWLHLGPDKFLPTSARTLSRSSALSLATIPAPGVRPFSRIRVANRQKRRAITFRSTAASDRSPLNSTSQKAKPLCAP